MWRENLYQPIEILVREHTVFPVDEHRHSFFEMAYIIEGGGSFSIRTPDNGTVETPYGGGALFPIPPEADHRFIVGTRSRFLFIRFTERYAEDFIGRYVGHTLAVNGTYPVPMGGDDARTAAALAGMIAGETGSGRRFCSHLLQYWANSMIVLAARNISSPVHATDSTDDRPVFMIEYIQQHINRPEMLRAEALGRVFNLSPSYLGRYFRRNFRETLQGYVARIRMGMVENLLANSRLTIKEIAYRTGYADASHLEKAFGRVHDITPLEYRRRHFTEA